MTLTSRILVPVFALVMGFPLTVQEASAEVEQGEADQDAAEKQQLMLTRQRMTARWNQVRAFERVGDREREVDRVPEPILSFSESTRDTGHLGTLWVWGTKGRPVAVFTQGKAYRKPVWGFELVALSERVSVDMHDGWRWSPKSALEMAPFPDAPRPADNNAARLRQMKVLARRFTVSEDYFDEDFELRLLPRPVYRYQDQSAGVIDGALFTFAHGTNPEAIAVIECRQQSSGPAWSYGLVPLAGAAVTAQLDGKTVWNKESTRVSKAQEMYSTWLEAEE